MKVFITILVSTFLILISLNSNQYTNSMNVDKMLIVIQAPSVYDPYYKKHFKQVIQFDIHMAKSIMGKDNIIVLADQDTLPYLEKELPKDILLESKIEDIWIRDFASVYPSKMLLFNYDRSDTPSIQKSFIQFVKDKGLSLSHQDLYLDGGNIVDNNKDAIILTNKILERNPDYNIQEIKAKLKVNFGVSYISIIPMDDEYLGHSDGMVMFLGDRTVLVNNYPNDPDFKKSVIQSLKSDLPGFKIIEINGSGYGKKYGDYASACGIYVNSIVTNRYIYVPTFSDKQKNKSALKVIQANTKKKVIPINAESVCFLGGNLRCLSWQLSSNNAKQLILKARE